MALQARNRPARAKARSLYHGLQLVFRVVPLCCWSDPDDLPLIQGTGFPGKGQFVAARKPPIQDGRDRPLRPSRGMQAFETNGAVTVSSHGQVTRSATAIATGLPQTSSQSEPR